LALKKVYLPTQLPLSITTVAFLNPGTELVVCGTLKETKARAPWLTRSLRTAATTVSAPVVPRRQLCGY
jgi:hypothetical protein